MRKGIILVSGKLRSGKDQLARYLIDIYRKKGYTINSDYFARALKENVQIDFKDVFGYLNELKDNLHSISSDLKELHPITAEKVKEISKQLGTEKSNFFDEKTKLTRMFLQIYGTEIFRNRIDENWWVKQLIQRVHKSINTITVITDVRFENEIELIKKVTQFDVKTIRIERDMKRDESMDAHPSEISLDTYKNWDCEIKNNRTLMDLYNEAEKVVDEMTIY